MFPLPLPLPFHFVQIPLKTTLYYFSMLIPPPHPTSRDENTYTPTQDLTGHTDWVRDVAWAPTVLQKSYIASASQDKTVRIWTSSSSSSSSDPSGAEWKSTVLHFDAVLWRVSWSLSGNVLAVSGGDNKVSLWKENLKGEWDCVKTIEE